MLSVSDSSDKSGVLQNDAVMIDSLVYSSTTSIASSSLSLSSTSSIDSNNEDTDTTNNNNNTRDLDLLRYNNDNYTSEAAHFSLMLRDSDNSDDDDIYSSSYDSYADDDEEDDTSLMKARDISSETNTYQATRSNELLAEAVIPPETMASVNFKSDPNKLYAIDDIVPCCFNPTDESLDFTKGEKLQINLDDTAIFLQQSPNDPNWWLVRRCRDNVIGWVPAEFMESGQERLSRINCYLNSKTYIDCEDTCKREHDSKNCCGINGPHPKIVRFDNTPNIINP